MKDPMELLHSKEQDLVRVRKEIDALRIVARMLDDDDAPAPNGEHKQESRQLIEMP
jgi:hypothetical protein